MFAWFLRGFLVLIKEKQSQKVVILIGVKRVMTIIVMPFKAKKWIVIYNNIVFDEFVRKFSKNIRD